MADQQTSTLLEGDEEVQYVYVSLPSDLDPVAFGPGSLLTIEGLATEQPTLRPSFSRPIAAAGAAASSSSAGAGAAAAGAAAGSAQPLPLQGEYVDNLGSILLLKEQPTATHNQKPTFAYVGHTDKQLQFSKPPS